LYTKALDYKKMKKQNVSVEEKGPVYECLRDGAWANDEGTPKFIISSGYIFDPIYLKQTFFTTGTGLFKLEWRAPEPDDDKKRALWESQIKKQDDAICAMRAKYGHISAGMTVKWSEYNSWTGQVAFECIGKIIRSQSRVILAKSQESTGSTNASGT
jgi:hypothetical protein